MELSDVATKTNINIKFGKNTKKYELCSFEVQNIFVIIFVNIFTRQLFDTAIKFFNI